MLWSGALIRAHCHPDQQIHWISNWPAKLFALFLDSLIDRKTSRDQELLSELNDSQSIENVLRSGAHISLTPWSTNKHVMIGSSYQSSLSPRSTTWIFDWSTNFLQSRALTRAHSVPERTTHVLRSEALIRAHWLPDRSKTSCDQELLSELIDSPDRPKNLLWSGALIRAHCYPDRQIHWISNWPAKLFALFLDSLIDRQTSRDQELLSELNDSQSIKNVLRSGAHISLTPWSTNKHVMIGSSYQSSLSPRSTTWIFDWSTNFLQSRALTRAHSVPERTTTSFSDRKLLLELIDSPIDQQTCYDRELLSELIDTPIDKMIRAHWPPD